jgi:hypothetical protein
MVVAEFKIDNATVKFHDDSLMSRKESEEALERVQKIIMRNLNAQIARGKTFEKKEK